MKLAGVHVLLSWQCIRECDHCFVWGSPRQTGTMGLWDLRKVLAQAREIPSVEWFYFEGGEPFLFYPVLLAGCREGSEAGFKVGIVTNGYWATSVEDAAEWLRPLAGIVAQIDLSRDGYHGLESSAARAASVERAARALGIPVDLVSIAEPESGAAPTTGQPGDGEWAVRYRGRAAVELSGRAARRPWSVFNECPYEDLREPGRVHVDPLGNVHICQGISLGNIHERPLAEIAAWYDPGRHPVTGPLLRGGPAGLVREYAVAHPVDSPDACYLCYEARRVLRPLLPGFLGPDQMYGVVEES